MKKRSSKRQTIEAINREVLVAEDGFIVSKTDATGRISYINRTFMEVSGFVESELLGHQHNVIRHPEMPRGVFQLLWQELKADREFFGYVKNLCRDGAYYWVFANVTPDVDEQGNLRGYYSVRRKPAPGAINAIEPIYARMLDEESRGDRKTAPTRSVKILQAYLAEQNQSYIQFMQQLDAA
ncbi:PAS domain-containing protein [Pseudoteredinibacter isoporae]|uniref:PAS domain S-box-containing protein n=1 Tax=Pseudoteredinibacter isoporae TaxID=570281 RepID=A0A7X0MZK5_9GAMM|nr:PAS domain-containing protein [Pseudoteredinibacter isoporae]MBB6523262.1 PAS domain S-box-containing protein [Pseudoteredinibacter isoporae]NHO88778.1 PAS domain-containing protein [Pseudoteredinibacter isoporae]NIB22531.1 PAS domain-containing protein [Pseudoteredinibacter isoporae]